MIKVRIKDLEFETLSSVRGLTTADFVVGLLLRSDYLAERFQCSSVILAVIGREVIST